MQEVEARLGGSGPMRSQTGGVIPVAFHVIHNGVIGNIPQSQIDAQIAVLNSAFSGMGVTFQLASVDRTLNATWFATTGGASEDAMHAALAIDPAHHLNIYTFNPSGGLLGWAYYPSSFPEGDVHHSVNLLYSSLPGGTAAPYDLGDTATHEVGHYMGLYHTFQGGCAVSTTTGGDLIADTPAESSPAFGCPVGRNTCASAGLDPIQNFMDYSDDACMYEFTPLQLQRMMAQVIAYRPSLVVGGLTAAQPRSWGQIKLSYR